MFLLLFIFFFFFFQAEDGIRDKLVTGVQTCALPISTVHLYNAAAPIFRRVVFGWDGDGRAECKTVAVEGTRAVMKFAETYLPGTDFGYEYSPEIFMDAELDFSLEICEAVMDVWQPGRDREIVLNLPCTIERSTPNVYADQI